MISHKIFLGFANSGARLLRHASKSTMATGNSINFSDFPEHRCLMIEELGDPTEKVKLKVQNASDVLPDHLGPQQILVEHLAACVNPADINVVQGVYGRKPKLPAIIGNEGITRVRMVGGGVTHLQPGDLALGVSLHAHWQSYSVQDSADFYKVPKELDITTATQLKVNPCTAYRMIKDFYPLKKGDTIIQNGANSAVGVYAIQLAKLWGFKTINVIRDRPNKEAVIDELKNLGADVVLTEEEVSKLEVTAPILKDYGKPKLFLNCVGGKNAINCQRMLDQGGYSVTYGAMSKQPFSLSASALIFKDHKYVGFWVSRWYQDRGSSGRRSEIADMLQSVCDMFVSGVLKPKASTLIDFENRNEAFSNSSSTKYIFSINKQ